MANKNKLTSLSITRVALVAAGSNPEAEIVLAKNAPPVVPPQPKEPVFMKKNIDKSKLSAEEQTALETLLSKSATDIEDAPAPPTPVEEVIKSLPPEAQAIIKSANDRADQAIAKANAATAAAEAAQQTANIEKAAREESEFVTANTELVKSFPGPTVDNAKMLYRMHKTLPKADYDAMVGLLKSGGAAIAATTVETGQAAAEVIGTVNELNAKAEELRKKNPEMSFSDALDQAMEQNPDLVRKARASK
jgi:predicted transcriptional regulator